jgi:hypothetical protein
VSSKWLSNNFSQLPSRNLGLFLLLLLKGLKNRTWRGLCYIFVIILIDFWRRRRESRLLGRCWWMSNKISKIANWRKWSSALRVKKRIHHRNLKVFKFGGKKCPSYERPTTNRIFVHKFFVTHYLKNIYLYTYLVPHAFRFLWDTQMDDGRGWVVFWFLLRQAQSGNQSVSSSTPSKNRLSFQTTTHPS